MTCYKIIDSFCTYVF